LLSPSRCLPPPVLRAGGALSAPHRPRPCSQSSCFEQACCLLLLVLHAFQVIEQD
jgi:hypothetical protein